jgi:HK97 gp10 family phage protein
MSIEINGLEVALGRLDLFTDIDKIEKASTKATLLLEREAAKKAPKGEIGQSITSKVDGVTGTVYTPHRLAPYLEYGTGIYSIHPKGGRKEVPWVYVEGQYNEPASKRIYTEQEADQTVAMMRADGIPAVKTYGSQPQPFLRPALDENREEIVRILGESLVND